jgi:hypothetical protein
MRSAFLILAIALLQLATDAFAANSYQVNTGSSLSINEFSKCRRVDNSSGSDLFVPTKTLAEWNAFIANPPSGVTVSACAAVQLVWTTQPAASITAGANILGVIEVRDAYGNPVDTGPDSTVNITLSKVSGNGTLAGSLTKAAVAGVVTFNAADTVNINLVGSKTLRATKADMSGSGGAGSISQDSNAFTIVNAPASTLAFTTPPVSGTGSSATFGLVAEIRDAYGNVVTSAPDATASVTLSLPTKPGNLTNSACGVAGVVSALSGTVTVSAVAGVATFSGLSLNVAGTYVVRATKADTSGSGGTTAKTGDSASFSLYSGDVTDLYWKDAAGTATNPNTTRTAGQTFTSGGIVACDAVGNTATNSTDSITFEIDDANNPTGDDLHGTTSANLSSGVATLASTTSSIYLASGTAYKLVATDDVTGATTATASGGVTVSAAAWTTMVFVNLTPTWPKNVNVIPPVQAQVGDAYGNLRTSGCSGNATLSLSTNPGGAGTFSGTTSVSQTGCIYTWSAVKIDVASTTSGFKLTAATANNLCNSSTTTCSGQSSAFSVSTAPGLNLVHAFDLADIAVGCRSGTGNQTAAFTYVPFDPNWFSGTVTYTLEFVASNSDGAARSVRLANSAGGTADVAAISVANGTSLTRFTGAITPTAGITSYRLNLDRCTTANALKVHSARIIVTQASNNAYATAVHVPLISALNTSVQTANLATSPADSTTSTTATQGAPEVYQIWHYDASRFNALASSGALMFYADFNSSSTSGTAYVELFDKTDDVLVTGTTLTRAATTATLVKTGWLDSSVLVDGHDYEVRIRISNSAYAARIHKAGLLLKIESMSKFATYWRVAPYISSVATGLNDYQRTNFDKANFSSPSVSFDCSGYNSASGLSVQLASLGNTNSGGTVSGVGGSSLTFTGTKGRQSATGLTLPAGAQSYGVNFTGSPGSLKLSGCYLIIGN